MKYIKLAVGLIIILSLILFTFSYSNKKDVKANLNIEKQELRAVWITPITGDVSTYKNEASYKLEITGILDMLESYNMNAVIYHVRTHNDALYPSEYNPVSKYMAQANFNELTH